MECNIHSRGLSWRILTAHHGRVYSLLDYLLMKSDASMHPEFIQLPQAQNFRDYLLRDPDSQAYRDLLTTSLVAESGVKRDVRVKLSAPSSSITEVESFLFATRRFEVLTLTSIIIDIVKVIERAHARLFARSHKPSNVITTGYRSVRI